MANKIFKENLDIQIVLYNPWILKSRLLKLNEMLPQANPWQLWALESDYLVGILLCCLQLNDLVPVS